MVYLDVDDLELPANPDEARALIDTKIRALSLRRNALSPIAKLPPEIIARVFALCQEDIASRCLSTTRIRIWLCLSQICTFLRDIALNSLELWTYIEVRLNGWTPLHRLQVERSKAHLLDVSVDADGKAFEETTAALEPLLSQLLHLDVTGYCTHSRLPPQFAGAANHLQSLEIFGCEIPKTTLSGGTPQLKSIKLLSCTSVPWESPIFRSAYLSHLKLSGCKPRPSWPQLLSILEPLDNRLKTLDLRAAVPQDSPSIVGGKFTLSKLSHLALMEDSYDHIHNFLNLVRFPPSASRDIHCVDGSSLDLFNCLPRSHQPFRQLKLLCNINTQVFGLKGWYSLPQTRDPQPDFVAHTRPIPQQLFLPDPSDADSLKGVIQEAESLRLHVERLPLSDDRNRPIWDFSSQLPRLTTLWVESEAPQFLQVLEEDSSAMEETQANTPSTEVDAHHERGGSPVSTAHPSRYPALENLKFIRISFDTWDGCPSPLFFDTLEKNLKLRFERSKGLRRLEFFKCDQIPPGRIDALSPYVSEPVYVCRDREDLEW